MKEKVYSALSRPYFWELPYKSKHPVMAENVKPQIDESWLGALKNEFESEYFKALKAFLLAEKKAGKTIFPPGPEIFNAFNSTPLHQVKCVILGQDPYHGPGQAHGLCFSVRKGVKPPPSLVNIYKEIESDLGIGIPSHGELTNWTRQGVLLLNAVLTVEAHKAASHQGKGWERFTDTAIKVVSHELENVVFMLWGKFAQSKRSLIDDTKHLILQTTHPSPFSAHYGFLGSKHFSQCNGYLQKYGKEPVDWSLE